MTISHDDVRHIAALARLAVDDDRLERLAVELNTILQHMQELQGVGADSAADPDESARGDLPTRSDDGPAQKLAHPIESFAPAVRDGFFLVPRLDTHEAESSA